MPLSSKAPRGWCSMMASSPATRPASGLRGHTVGETSEDVKALIATAPSITGPGFFVPVRDGRLLRWLLANGYRAVWQATLMTSGASQEPAGAFLPSIAY